MLGFRHLVDEFVRRLMRWRGCVLFSLPLEGAVPVRKLCGWQRSDFVEIGNLGITDVIGSKKFSDNVVSVNTLRIGVNVEITYRVAPTIYIKRALKYKRRLTASCLDAHLECFGSITEFIVGLQAYAKVVRRLGMALLRSTLKHLKSDIRRSVSWIKQVRNVILGIGATQISGFTNVPACYLFITLEAVGVLRMIDRACFA